MENQNLKNNKILLFHERIEIANIIHRFLKEKGFKAGIYHTNLPIRERIRNIVNYRKGKQTFLYPAEPSTKDSTSQNQK